MKLLVVGVGYRSAPPAMLAALATGTAQTPEVLSELLGSSEVTEAVLVSTCNRIEVYAAVRSFHGALGDVATVLARRSGTELTRLAPALYAHYADDAIRQIFTVITGLDSLVQGERQVLGQVRAAYAEAARLGAVGSVLHEVMQRALRIGKRVHAEAAAGTPPCLADSALRLGMKEFGSLRGANALVVGAGQMAGLAAQALRRHGVGELVVLSRSLNHAHDLAVTVGARPGTMDDIASAMCRADVVVSATTSPRPVLDERVAAARLSRSAPLLLVDLAMPADVTPGLASARGVIAVDLTALARSAALPGAAPNEQLAASRRILSEELAEFTADRRAAEVVTPMIVALRERADDLVRHEISGLVARRPQLTESERADIARAMRKLVNSLLHDPMVRAKELAATEGDSWYATALATLFDLTTASVSAPAPTLDVASALDAGPEPSATRSPRRLSGDERGPVEAIG